MGFKNGAYAKVWGVEPKSDASTKIQLSVSKKNKETGTYETEFSGFVSFIGSLNAKKAAALSTGDRIKLGEVDVTVFFNKEKNERYTVFKCFSFEPADSQGTGAKADNTAAPSVDEGHDGDESRLPF